MTALASCTLDVAIAKLDCVQLLAHTHASNSSNQCSQATKIQLLCTQTETVAVGYVHRRCSNTLSTCTIWECASLTHHQQMVQKVCLGQGCIALTPLFSRFHYGCRLSCGTDSHFKTKGSFNTFTYK